MATAITSPPAGQHRQPGRVPEPPALGDRIIREEECRRLSGLSRTSRWRLERSGEFPRRRQISRGCTGWLASELAEWLTNRKLA